MPDSSKTGALATAAELVSGGDPVAAAGAVRQALRDAYWVHHDLAAVTVVGLSGIGACLSTAETVDGKTGYLLRSEAKAMLYDLASFTWPGWGEPQIEIVERDTQLGLEAAALNLRLAEQLDKGDLPTSRARWMYGAQLMAADLYAEAEEQFTESADLAQRAGADGEAILSRAFGVLCSILAGNAAAEPAYAQVLEELRAEEEGEALVEQVVVARSVFG